MYKHIRVFALLTLFFASAAILFAQNATTSLRGTVKDPSGAVVPGATIVLTNPSTGFTQSATSSSSGEYQFQQLPPAKYTITITAAGFGTQTRTAELLVNQPATLNPSLSVTANNVVVEVNDTQAVNTVDASLGTSKDNATIQALPSEERNVADLLSLQPGVFFIPVTATQAASQDGRSGAVNGGRSDQGNVTVDGVDDNDQVNGYAFFGVLRETQDSTQEFRVTTGDANADAGRSSGAQISLVTKSGTNKFHGAAYEYFRPTNTVANDYFNKQGQLAQGLANRPPKLIRHVFGVDVGGPIVKDKLFFFANYEGRRQAESDVVTQIVPTANFQNGILAYQGDDASGNLDPVTQYLSAAQISTLDAANGCGVCNTTAYAPGPGPNPNALAYFKEFPAANGKNGGDGGYNTGSYTFASPAPYSTNTTIVRLDYVPTPKHRIFVRGNLQKDVLVGDENLPGQPAAFHLVSNNKGIAAGDTWTISPSLVNDIRYGFTRQGSGNYGIGSGDYVDFRFYGLNPSTPTAETRTTILSSPVNNIIDNLTLSKGKHTVQMGVNWRLVHQNRVSDANSYSFASSNPSWLTGDPPDPSTLPGVEAVDSGFSQSYQEAFANIVGTVPSVTNIYNYQATSATSGTLLPDGAPLPRHFSANEFEGYVQDAWRILPNLTLTAGLRYTVLQTPSETKGQEVTPTIDTDAWYKQREASALQGAVYEPDLTFAAAGRYYGKPGFYAKSKDNVAPRLAIVYSPDNKTSIRAGGGIYYDHFGEGLINIFDQNGSFGLNSSISNPAGVYSLQNSPRFTDNHTLPFSNGTADPTVTYPYTYPQNAFAITWGLDNKMKTPYSETFDLSLQRELKSGFSVEAAYVGRLGRHLLQSLDLAEPVDFTDPQGGGDYYTAGSALSRISDQNGGDPGASVAAIPYFEHVFPYMANLDYVGESATQAIYSDEWAPARYSYGATTALADIDFYCSGPPLNYCPAGTQSKFWQDQFSSLYALSTIGRSSYHSIQLSLHHSNVHGLQFDVNYTISRSLDWGSDAERSIEFITGGNHGANSAILNTWKPDLNNAVSDFNSTHLLTANWVYQLPFGKGRAFFGSAPALVNALIGGWQSSGIFRETSGLPFSLFEPGWTTDWQEESYGVVTDKSQVHAHRSIAKDGTVTYFKNVGTINQNITTGNPIRLPYPGEAGQRNNFYGDGYINLDSGLSKSWTVSDYGALKFAWEVYNVTNTVRFDPLSIGFGLGSGSLGTANATYSPQEYRRMQFALRYDF